MKDDSGMMELYEQGLSINRMVEKSNFESKQSVIRWMNRNDLEANYGWLFKNKDLKTKITSVLFDNPSFGPDLLFHINNNSPPDERHEKQELYNKLIEMKREGIVYRQFHQPEAGAPNRKHNWNNQKWFLDSDFIVENALEEAENERR